MQVTMTSDPVKEINVIIMYALKYNDDLLFLPEKIQTIFPNFNQNFYGNIKKKNKAKDSLRVMVSHKKTQ